jgi:hypothetical protein
MVAKKLSFEEKQERRKAERVKRIRTKPVIGMANYESSIATFRLQVIGKTKHSVTMKTINGKGTLKLSTNDGRCIEDIIKIEPRPCDITPSITHEGKTVQIQQDSDVPM